MKKLFATIICSLCIGQSFAQDVLSNYVNKGLENNQSIIIQSLKEQAQQENLKQSKALFLPNITFNASYTKANGGRTIDVPVGDLMNPVYQGLNDILGENLYPTNLKNTSEQLLPNNFHDTKLRIIQPLFNAGIYYQYKAEKLNLTQTQIQKQEAENKLVKEIKTTYFNYLALLEQKKILSSTKSIFQDVLRANQKMFENHKVTKDVVLATQLEISKIQSNLNTITTNIQNTKAFFNYLLNQPLATDILVDTISIKPMETYNKTQLLSNTENSNNTQLIKNQIEQNKIAIRNNKAYVLPTVSAMADVGYQGFDYHFNNQDYWLVGLNLQWSVFNGNKNKSIVKQSRIKEELLQTALQQMIANNQLQVQNAHRTYVEAHTNYQDQTTEVEYANQVYQMAIKKYKENLINYIDFNRAVLDKEVAEIKHAIAKYNIKIKEVEMLYVANILK